MLILIVYEFTYDCNIWVVATLSEQKIMGNTDRMCEYFSGLAESF